LSKKMGPPLDKVLPAVYIDFLHGLERILGTKIYLFGGWVTAGILQKSYFGDIDIVTEGSLPRIKKALNLYGLKFSINPHGTVRVRLSDGNFLDINSLNVKGTDLSVIDFLRSNTFSINACGIDVSQDCYISSDLCFDDLSSKHFRIGEQAHLQEQRPLSVLRSWLTLQDSYGLTFIDTTGNDRQKMIDLELVWPSSNLREPNPLPVLKSVIEKYLPPFMDIYTAKGAVRCSLLNEFTLWDDVDVLIRCDLSTIINHFESIEVEYSLNHYGNPKLLLPEGQSVDVIPIGAEGRLTDILFDFFHHCDRVLWSWQTEDICDPTSALEDVISRQLRFYAGPIDKYSEEDLAYYALKTVYLSIRHGMQMDDRSFHHIESPQAFTPHHHRLCVAMLKELSSILSIGQTHHWLRSIDQNMNSSAVNMFKMYFNDSTHLGDKPCGL